MNLQRLAAAAAVLICFTSSVHAQITLNHIGRYQNPTAKFEAGAAEIVAFDTPTSRIFVVNAQDATVDVLDASDPASPTAVGKIDLKAIPGVDPAKIGPANSVAARDGLLAVAVEAAPKTDPGLIAFYDAAADFSQPVVLPLTSVATGALPDAVTFSNTGHFVMSANEGERSSTFAKKVVTEDSIAVLPISGLSMQNAKR
jgi:2',3'-cyclic-nucleotide 2'-phosphodiesterase / 3'-nucleotidase / 5'-nucleotidase